MARPRIKIDPNQVLRLASEGYKVTEIAQHFNASRFVIHRRFATELTKGKALLKLQLRRAQLRAAMNGNTTMLIWLGKQHLEQSDRPIDSDILSELENAGLSKEDLLSLIQKSLVSR